MFHENNSVEDVEQKPADAPETEKTETEGEAKEADPADQPAAHSAE